MLVGLTYDLRSDYLEEGYSEEETAEFDSLETIGAIDNALKELGYQTERIGNIKALTSALAGGRRWDMVFNIAEGMHGFAREAQVPAILEAYNIPFVFSDSLTMALTLHKGYTKNIIRDNGINTPDFMLVNNPSDIDNIALPFPLFAKPVAEGTGKGVTALSKIKDKKQLREVCMQLLAKFRQPVLVETFLPGREFTVGILGTDENARSIGVAEIILKKNAEQEVYSFENKEKCEDLVEYRLAEDKAAEAAAALAIGAWQVLGCRDGGRVDVRLDDKGNPSFMEVNPLSGLHPTHSDLPIICNLQNIAYSELIKSIMESAVSRIGEIRDKKKA